MVWGRSFSHSGISHFRPPMGQIGTNLGLFKISFLFILAHCAKMNRKLILKSPRFVPFGANLAALESKHDNRAGMMKGQHKHKQAPSPRDRRPTY